MVKRSKTADFTGCRKITNNTYESTVNYPPIIVSAGARKADACIPKFQKHIHKWAHIMIETSQWRFVWAWDNAEQKHVFQFIAHLWRKVEEDERYQANRLLLPGLFVTQRVEVINAKREYISTFFATSTKMFSVKPF